MKGVHRRELRAHERAERKLTGLARSAFALDCIDIIMGVRAPDFEAEIPETSRMHDALCPECSFILYVYELCAHTFVDVRYSRCHWDGSLSKFCRILKGEDLK